MSVQQQQLEQYLSEHLKTDEFSDLCPNGIQVSGNKQITKVITAVSASVALFQRAIDENADTVLVHHGIIWNFERPLYRGGYRERLRLLLANNINLFAYHLPLDAHPVIGNNALLCQKFGLTNIEPFRDTKGQYIGMQGRCDFPDKNGFFKIVEETVNRPLTIFPYGPDQILSVGVMSGGAQKNITQAVADNLDVFITGEVSEHIMHYAQEENIHFISAGHYATEKYGIIALGELIQNKFGLEVTFIDIPNPV